MFMSEMYGYKIACMIVTKEFAGLVNHLSSKEDPKQGSSRTDRGDILLQRKQPNWKSAEFTATG